MINSIKNISIKLKKIIITNKVIILMTLPFFAMDIFTRAFGLKISIFRFTIRLLIFSLYCGLYFLWELSLP